MSRPNRIELYRQIEEHRGRPLIAYVTSKRDGVLGKMATDALPSIIDQLDSLPPETAELDFLIASYGGDPMVAWRLMSLIRQRVSKAFVLIPQSAYSAATMLALGGDEIVMHPNSHLGPVDMQITTHNTNGSQHFSTEEITAFLDFVRQELGITDQEHIRRLFEVTCKEVGTLGVGFTARSSKLAVDLGERLLGMHLKESDASKRRTLVEDLSRTFQAHDYPVSREEAISIGLHVSKVEDKQLDDLMWKLWRDIEEDLKERSPFRPIFELLNNPEAAKVLLSAPPATADKPYSEIEPIDFEVVEAIIESSRLQSQRTTRGKILACRMEDLEVKWNILPTHEGWLNHEPTTVTT